MPETDVAVAVGSVVMNDTLASMVVQSPSE